MIGRERKMSVIKVILMVLMISLPVLTYAQTLPEPPIDSGEFGWLRWIILILTGGLITSFGVIKKIYDDTLKSKDNQIEGLNKIVEELNDDKDSLQKDIMDKVIPAVISSNELIKSFLNRNV
jgi:hypothetical protein